MFNDYIKQFIECISIDKIFNKRGNWVVEFTKK